MSSAAMTAGSSFKPFCRNFTPRAGFAWSYPYSIAGVAQVSVDAAEFSLECLDRVEGLKPLRAKHNRHLLEVDRLHRHSCREWTSAFR